MSKPTGLAVAKNAAGKAKAGKIPYSQQDCQAFVERCVIDCGGSMDYRGSNHMYRSACDWVKPLPAGTKPADLEPGMLVFRHAFDGGEVAAGYNDGLGNARHVGLYCGVDGVEVAHSSVTSVGNGAQVSALIVKSNPWTHYGPAKCVTYEGAEQQEGGSVLAMDAQSGTVWSESGGPVRFRPTAGTDEYGPEVAFGTKVTVIELATNSKGEEWYKVILGGKTGYIMKPFIRTEGGNQPVPQEAGQVTREEFEALKSRVLALEGRTQG